MPGKIRKASLSEFVVERDGQLSDPGMHYPKRVEIYLLPPTLVFRFGGIHDKGRGSGVSNSAIYPDAPG